MPKSMWNNVGARATIIIGMLSIATTLAVTALGYFKNKDNPIPTNIVQNFLTGINVIIRNDTPPPKSLPTPIPVATTIHENSTPAVVSGSTKPFKFDAPRIIRDKQGNLSVELTVTNLMPYSLTLISPQDASTACGISAIDDKGVIYKTPYGDDCSIREAIGIHTNDPDYINKLIRKGQEIRGQDKSTLQYSLSPVGQPSFDATSVKSLKAEIFVIHRNNKPFTTRENISIPNVKFD